MSELPQEDPQVDDERESAYLSRIPLESSPIAPKPPYSTWRAARASAKPLSLEHLNKPIQKYNRFHSSQVLIAGFALMILIGTLLLKLPIAAARPEGIAWNEAFFTATSAITVTGLTVISTANEYSFFGQAVILILLQVGGIGFISFSVLLFRLIGRRVTLNERFLVQQTVGTQETGSATQLAIFVLIITVSVEAVGAFLLWLRWRTQLPDLEALWYAIFHAISSYCNAGFDLFSGTDRGILFGFGSDTYTLLVLSALIIVGGFGVTIQYDLGTYFKPRPLSLNTRITLMLAVVLTVTGVIVMMLDRKLYEHVLAQLSFGEQLMVSFFTIVASRTAGLTILPLEQLGESTQLIIILWMFIGGSPASMAGGVSTSTVGVLILAVIATIKGQSKATGFERTIPEETIAKAVAIMTVSTLLVVLVTLTLSLLRDGSIFVEAFEVVSAFSNTGYSLGITADLSVFERVLIAFTMFWGRLGPLTIVVAMAERAQPSLVNYPEEPVILG